MSPASPGPQPGGPAPAASLRQVLDGLHQGVVLRDGEGTIVDVNPAAEQILGRTRAELIGRRTVTDGDGVNPDGSALPRRQSASSIALATGRDVVGAALRHDDAGRRAALHLRQRARAARGRRDHGRRLDVRRRDRAAAGRGGARGVREALPAARRERRRPDHQHRPAGATARTSRPPAARCSATSPRS